MALTEADRLSLVSTVDLIEELSGAGIAYIGLNSSELVRNAPVGICPSLIVTFQVQAETNPHPRQTTPQQKTHLARELLQLGLSCGSTAIWALGTVLFSAAAAPTAGVTGAAAYVTGAATVASSIQCGASGYRVYNEVAGRVDRNETLDNSGFYQGAMLGLDAVQLAGAGVSIVATRRAAAAFARSGTSMSRVAAGAAVSRPMRKAISAVLGNPNGLKRLQSVALTAKAREELLSALGAGLDLTGSATGGLGKEIIVWISEAH